MNTKTLISVLNILQNEYKNWKTPIVTDIAEKTNQPFKVLISTILSLRTKDEVTTQAARRLFRHADTPETMKKLPLSKLEKLIYPVGFYKKKSNNIHSVCAILIDTYNSQVPDDLEQLLSLPGVGRKTANLVLTRGFNKKAICVDTHVHRITNRLGYIHTKTPEETEMELREILPRQWWIPINDILVAFGQNLCKPVSPLCSPCPVNEKCERVGVIKSR
ncbi:MAG: endonuclease III [bacterium]